MLHGSAFFLIIGIYLAIVVFALTMLWRIAGALEHISRHLLEISKDVKDLSAQPPKERE